MPISEREFDALWREYERVFGEAPPMFQLPAGLDEAARLIRVAIAEGSTRVIDESLPPDVLT